MKQQNDRRAVQPQPVRLGASYAFTPSAFEGERVDERGSRLASPRKFMGQVVYINRAHRYFTVAVEVHGRVIRESFPLPKGEC